MQVTDRSRIVRAQGDSETSLWSGLGILAGAALLGGAAWDWFSGSAAKRKEAKERESAQVPVVPLLNVDEQISATMASSDITETIASFPLRHRAKLTEFVGRVLHQFARETTQLFEQDRRTQTLAMVEIVGKVHAEQRITNRELAVLRERLSTATNKISSVSTDLTDVNCKLESANQLVDRLYAKIIQAHRKISAGRKEAFWLAGLACGLGGVIAKLGDWVHPSIRVLEVVGAILLVSFTGLLVKILREPRDD